MPVAWKHTFVVAAEVLFRVPEETSLAPLPRAGHGFQFDRFGYRECRQTVKGELFARVVLMFFVLHFVFLFLENVF